MSHNLGQHTGVIRGSKFTLFVRALFWLALSGGLVYFAFVKNWVNTADIAFDRKYLLIAALVLIGLCAVWAFTFILKLVRNKVELYENGMFVHSAFRNIEIMYDQISHIDWITRTLRLSGIIPIGRTYYVSIRNQAGKAVATLSSSDYAGLKKNMLALDEKLKELRKAPPAAPAIPVASVPVHEPEPAALEHTDFELEMMK